MNDLSGRGPLGLKGEKPRKTRKARRVDAESPGQTDRMFVSKVLRDFAKGQECQMKSEWCNGDLETVVLCHSRRRAGAGFGQKPHDFWGYHGCSNCHAHEDDLEDRELYDAIRRTQWAVFRHFGTLTP